MRKIMRFGFLIALLGIPASLSSGKAGVSSSRQWLHDYDKVINENRYDEWVSPDGCVVSYAVPGGDGSGMKVILADVATGKKTPLLESPRWIEIDWSPDSSYLAAINHWDGHSAQVLVYRLERTKDGTNSKMIYKSQDEDYGVHWGMVAWNLETNTAILSKMIEHAQDGCSFQALDLKKGKLLPIQPGSIYSVDREMMRDAPDNRGRWLSPSGKYVCCYHPDFELRTIFLGDRDSRTTCSLMTSVFGNYDVKWSPDSKFIAISDVQNNLNTISLTVFYLTPVKGKMTARIVYRAPNVDGTEWKLAKWDNDRHAVVQAQTAADPKGPSGYGNQYSISYKEITFDRINDGSSGVE